MNTEINTDKQTYNEYVDTLKNKLPDVLNDIQKYYKSVYGDEEVSNEFERVLWKLGYYGSNNPLLDLGNDYNILKSELENFYKFYKKVTPNSTLLSSF